MKSKTRIVLLVVPILLLLLSAGGYAGYRGYTSTRQARLVRQALSFIERADEKKAYLCLQRALNYDPKDARASRLVAELLERDHSPAALEWRSRIVQFNPHSPLDRLALAQTAIMFREYATATNALEGVEAAGRNTTAYHNIAGLVSSALNRLDEAEVHFAEAARLDPTNPAPQLNLAITRLHGTNAAALVGARADLARLASLQPSVRCQALRELVIDAARSKQTNAACALSKELVRQTNSTTSDQLMRLDVLLGARDPEARSALAGVQRDAGTNPLTICEIGTWQVSRFGPTETLAWLRTLPPASLTNPPVAVLAAECQVKLSDWKGLLASLQRENWTDLEFLRHALLTRALRGQELSAAAKTEWEMALKATNGQKGNLLKLLGLTGEWKWRSDSEEILWTIVNQFPTEKWAFQSLGRALFEAGRTRLLMTLYSQEVKRSPGAPLGLKNNLAMTALLLDAKELKPADLAREVYEQGFTNATFISTYAFSLYVQGKNQDALKVIQQLKPAELLNPSIAGYYGLILKATGDAAKARVYLQAAAKAPLLPEERKLFERAMMGV